jgi:TRAP-type mannitol/chloroaromatic compound transport system permease large subunit
MDPDIIAGMVGVAVLLLLIIVRCPISFALLFIGTGGLIYFMGLVPAITYIPSQIFKYLAKFTFIAVPLFLLMGLPTPSSELPQAPAWLPAQPSPKLPCLK